MADDFKVEMRVQLGESPESVAAMTLLVHPSWAPLGAARFRELVEAGYYDGCAFHRVVAGFMAQCGIHGNTGTYAQWGTRRIKDDPVKTSNARGTLAFATSGPDARTVQFFINLADNSFLDSHGFSPFAEVLPGGMEGVVDKVYDGYGEGAPKGRGPEQGRVKEQGDAYLREFPKLSRIATARVVA